MAASSSTLSTFVPPLMMKDEDKPRNWTDLPSELTSSILLRLGAIEILENAQKVCTSWRRICKHSSMWRKIDMRDLGNRGQHNLIFDVLCRQAVDLSQGGLLEIYIENFATDSLLTYIAYRSSNLRSLGLGFRMYHHYTSISNKGLVNAIEKHPLLETLEVSHPTLKLNLKAIGHACPQLKTLKLNSSGSDILGIYELNYGTFGIDCDDEYDALAIAESMPELRHLQLLGDRLTASGLNAILDGCPHLEHLDLRMCFNINMVGNLEKQCLERVKEFRRPNDSTADYPFDIIFVNYDLNEHSIEIKESEKPWTSNVLFTHRSGLSGYIPSHIKCDDDDYALAIAETMPELRHLQLLGDRLTDNGLNAILDGCPHLVGNLEKQCLERVKEFRRPNDSTADYPFDITIFSYDSESDDSNQVQATSIRTRY
ncbi:PREDICTED: putative F-box protein At4g05475 [Camelina sativa]|uniref:F-box protein At4g05475 n=1 Tax=Camelina sativa TaxID=90675 RepID=A0ABM0T0M4_CAMSA|nr:PREDICTED: putative F-box protein At4g05475 [Camelina sativa]